MHELNMIDLTKTKLDQSNEAKGILSFNRITYHLISNHEKQFLEITSCYKTWKNPQGLATL